MLPLRLRADTNRRTVSWSTLFRLDGTDEIDQAGGSLIFARSQGGLRDKDELGKSMKALCFQLLRTGVRFSSPPPKSLSARRGVEANAELIARRISGAKLGTYPDGMGHSTFLDVSMETATKALSCALTSQT